MLRCAVQNVQYRLPGCGESVSAVSELGAPGKSLRFVSEASCSRHIRKRPRSAPRARQGQRSLRSLFGYSIIMSSRMSSTCTCGSRKNQFFTCAAPGLWRQSECHYATSAEFRSVKLTIPSSIMTSVVGYFLVRAEFFKLDVIVEPAVKYAPGIRDVKVPKARIFLDRRIAQPVARYPVDQFRHRIDQPEFHVIGRAILLHGFHESCIQFVIGWFRRFAATKSELRIRNVMPVNARFHVRPFVEYINLNLFRVVPVDLLLALTHKDLYILLHKSMPMRPCGDDNLTSIIAVRISGAKTSTPQ